MGEIADALRRAQGSLGFQGRRAPEERRPARDAAAAPDLHAVRRPSATVLPTLRPTDPSVLVDDSPEQDACRRLAVRLRAELEARGARSVAIVSAARDEGKTATSCNLALALASMSTDREIALVDLDLRRPSIADVLSLDVRIGVDDVLAGTASIDEARVEVAHPQIDILAAAGPRRTAHELLTRRRLGELFDALESRYSVIVVDTPPSLPVPDASLILERVAVCIPIAFAGTTRVRAYRAMLEMLPRRQILSKLLVGVPARGTYAYVYDTSG